MTVETDDLPVDDGQEVDLDEDLGSWLENNPDEDTESEYEVDDEPVEDDEETIESEDEDSETQEETEDEYDDETSEEETTEETSSDVIDTTEELELEDIQGYPKPEGWTPDELEGQAKDVHDYWRRVLTVKGQETSNRIKAIEERFEGLDPAEARRQGEVLDAISKSDYFEVVEALIDPSNPNHNLVVNALNGQTSESGGGSESANIDRLIEMSPKEILQACVDEDGDVDIETYEKMVQARDEGIARLVYDHALSQNTPAAQPVTPAKRANWTQTAKEYGLDPNDGEVFEAEFKQLQSEADEFSVAEVRELQTNPAYLVEVLKERVEARRGDQLARLRAA